LSPTLSIVLLWSGFAATHILLSSLSLRPRLVGVLGDRGFLGVYSLISLAFFWPLVATYWSHKHAGPMLWSIPMTTPVLWVLYALMAIAFLLLVAGLMSPSPASFNPSTDSSTPALEPSGIHFITRHAVFMAMAVFGIAHLIPNGFASDVAFFGGFPLFVLIGAVHQDARKLVTEPERYTAYHAATPLLPFTGANTLRGMREISLIAMGIALAVTFFLRRYHFQLFG
jgi:uncharacterized membrane protein